MRGMLWYSTVVFFFSLGFFLVYGILLPFENLKPSGVRLPSSLVPVSIGLTGTIVATQPAEGAISIVVDRPFRTDAPLLISYDGDTKMLASSGDSRKQISSNELNRGARVTVTVSRSPGVLHATNVVVL